MIEINPIPLTNDEINAEAENFLGKYHSSYTLPIPIEEIIDLQLKIDIIPIPGLRRAMQGYDLDIDGFISSDFKSISIDEYVQESINNRYRFTLAHEIAHRELHEYVYKQLSFDSIADWKRIINDIPDWPVRWLEVQANYFAGFILVPRRLLKEEFARAKKDAQEFVKNGKYDKSVIIDIATGFLSKKFEVSEEAMKVCLKRDRLVK